MDAGAVRSVFVMYSVMAVWSVVAAVLRFLLSLRSGVPLDVLPAITGSLGVLALLAIGPRVLRRLRDRPGRPGGEMIEVPKDARPAAR